MIGTITGTKLEAGKILATMVLDTKTDIDISKKYELKVYRKKRSNNANGYAWELMSKLAEVMLTSKDEVYEIMLERYGTNLTDENDNAVIISSQTELKSNKELHIAYIGDGLANDKLFNHYRIIKGSSQYNSKEMSVFINGIVSECKELGIETLEDIKIKKMVEEWGM